MNRNENDKRTFYYIVWLLIIVVVTIVLITLQGCAEPEIEVFENTEVVSYSNNLIKLESDNIVVLRNGMGHMDKWWIPEGTTFEITVLEVDDYVRFYDTQDFATFDDRIYCVGEGRNHVTDFTALNPPVDYYYFTIEVIINGVRNTVDYVIDSN